MMDTRKFYRKRKYEIAYNTDKGPVLATDKFCKSNDLLGELEKYKASDEYLIGDPVPESSISDIGKATITYFKLLRAVTIVRGQRDGKDSSRIISMYDSCEDWLKNKTDFCYAPASTQYHDSEKGGLIKHSLRVYNNICDLWKTDKFMNIDIYNAVLVALVHDWCKIGLYEQYSKNVKENGSWKAVDAYKRSTPKFPFGHGEASMYLAERWFNLSLEEALAVRWHMGKWYTNDVLDNDLQTANENYPLVLMLQFADQLSIVNY